MVIYVADDLRSTTFPDFTGTNTMPATLRVRFAGDPPGRDTLTYRLTPVHYLRVRRQVDDWDRKRARGDLTLLPQDELDGRVRRLLGYCYEWLDWDEVRAAEEACEQRGGRLPPLPKCVVGAVWDPFVGVMA